MRGLYAAGGLVQSATQNANDQFVLWDLDPNVLQNDHAPPHFHARYGEFEATIDLGTLDVIQGQLPRRAFEPGPGTGDDT
jgi:hypothetical protein